jgi:hypothetical protein
MSRSVSILGKGAIPRRSAIPRMFEPRLAL